MENLWRAHPWHGIGIHELSPQFVNTYIEITPFDGVKYELDKESGLMKIDRPQLFSNIVPALYGFIPRTYCGEGIAALCMESLGRKDIKGDGDPLDILVLSEKNIQHGDILVHARPIGGLRMVDKNEADDKIIAIMKDDIVYNGWKELEDIPSPILNRILHYFLTYKQIPSKDEKPTVEIPQIYGRKDAYEVISRSMKDYDLLQNKG
ncbi:MAG TPA: inorganic pyrophosphatase [Saprospiraceae bacterium]|nr:inorganic pyrophosphatase [Saprospiraceae bacterium]HQW56810.1 inorganic pyrophosphatase [Saprospiraceae bacterium]